MKKIIDALPLVVFASLIIVLFSFLSDKNDQLETALIDSSFPDFNLGSLSDESRILTKQDIIKLPALINVWATWCIACRVEHPFLMKLKEESRLTIYGLNYKDNKLKALDLLERDGNPFEFSIYDFEGRLAIDLGVYGAPETFFIDENGLIRERHVGVIDERVWEEKFSKYLNE
ncbi:DsbE family thiol:disulfide interchange protein [Gammaproteobacteria bacterium]|jgi:cytochrome c biogenesis protein CcmG/thiol:disulfide interchange protein DsbE|nr:DsbE family thiol:disulfide interchange protein [Gammaproteobacteria bacterium]|tara:strand:+ start:426 stop:947 length:522 start_codon:yes stop_codon:yes gene_type:complete